MNANMMEEYLQFVANRRLAQIGLSEQFRSKESIPMDVRNYGPEKGKELFETRVTDYQTGGALTWD